MNLHRAQQSLQAFIAQLVIDTPAGRVRLGDVLADYQAEFFRDIAPALEQLVGRKVSCQWRRFFAEWPRGHAKTFCLAVVILWLLVASRRKLTGIGAAGDRDQAKLLRDSIADIVRANPALEHVVNLTAYKVENPHTGTTFEILSSDAATSYGQTPDIVVADELVHWQRADLWHSLFSSAAKKSNSVLVVITNAGWQESEWWAVRERIRADQSWRFSRLNGPQAPWITQDDLAEQRRHLPDKVFRRLWLNEWCPTAGDALELADIDRAIVLDAAPNRPTPGQVYVGGFDIGIARNFSAFVLLSKSIGHSKRITKPAPCYAGTTRALADLDFIDLPSEPVEYRHYPGDGRLKLVAVRVWKPETGRVSLEAVEREILNLHDRFGISRLSFDVWQAEYLGQRLAKAGVPTVPTHFTPNNLQAMASATLDAFRERLIDLYPHDQLTTDLRALRVVEKSYGYRLTSPETSDGGHGDCATALSLALLAAKEIRGHYSTQRQLVYN